MNMKIYATISTIVPSIKIDQNLANNAWLLTWHLMRFTVPHAAFEEASSREQSKLRQPQHPLSILVHLLRASPSLIKVSFRQLERVVSHWKRQRFVCAGFELGKTFHSTSDFPKFYGFEGFHITLCGAAFFGEEKIDKRKPFPSRNFPCMSEDQLEADQLLRRRGGS
jgi:hypothetical protein